MKGEKLFVETGTAITGAVQGNLFGKFCFKINSKPFVCFFENCMVLKLTGEAHKTVIALKGTLLFDPSHKGRPMKEWVQVYYTYKKLWPGLTMQTLDM